MRPYIGKIKIACLKKACKKINGDNIAPECCTCKDAVMSIINLEGAVVCEVKRLTAKEADDGVSDSR